MSTAPTQSPDGRSRRLYRPRRVEVREDPHGAPAAIAGIEVETLREEWLLEDRWWTLHPLRRRYFELVLLDGSDVVVFYDQLGGGWYRQRA